MGLRTMVSPTRGKASHFQPVARQSSLYNLTLDEVQNQLGDIGKPLNSMNLDELLRTVIAVEENQQHISHDIPSTSNAGSSSNAGNLNLSRTVSRKTVDEVWSEIVQHEQENVAGGDGDGDGDGSLEGQPTLGELGEMTLEDFLIRAGAINLANQDIIAAINSHQLMVPESMGMQRPEWLQYHQIAAVQQQQMAVLGSGLPVASPVFGSTGDVGYRESQLDLTMQAALTDSQATTAERKRQFSDEMMEKTIERRQKRMIKNRESAARSRARKQAYTNQLEQEVSRLRKTNWRLKKQQELEMLLPLNRFLEPKYQLRRTSSAPF